MRSIEQVIESLNKSIETTPRANKGYFVGIRRLVPNSSFPAYKEFRLEVSYIKDRESTPFITVVKVARAINKLEEEYNWDKIFEGLLIEVFGLIYSKEKREWFEELTGISNV